ncbi:precorrin-6y C5,15-methyltransferase (decarboxylating) subunit CbiE [Caldichromatium japonicum]|uniref:Precorrin-6y C5,15-methyltransferase (Decarboxylating) subunit CbiE n=2 Tax=Caldichromatium japonicum TaxID=2699430 RepID=A0A6G7VH03_9GAMM|nr:precorrin-6y C5,15-methyltransferase (decarboxylating) subunit CbiE [Caldichromatium japonicum]
MNSPGSPSAWLTVVGINEDGLAGLGDAARAAIRQARVLFGGGRHLALIPEQPDQERRAWPSPFERAYEEVLALRGQPVCVLASGDPMFYGVGARLAERLPIEEMLILPAPSSVALAAARLGWSLPEVRVIPAHRQPLAGVRLYLAPGARLMVFSADGKTPAQLAGLLVDSGYGPSRLIVFEHLGGRSERRLEGTAADWSIAECAALNLIALECRAKGPTPFLSRRSALPDTAFVNDGQLTKRPIRALTLAYLAPGPGELLWDVGAGCGSIAIEWMRADDGCQAIAIEPVERRRAFIERNREALGVPGLQVIDGSAPEALAGLPAPDAIFIGGGLTTPGVFESCWSALKNGGRLVTNAVTLESEARLLDLHARLGGELIRLAIEQAAPLGRFTAWRPAMPIALLCLHNQP